MWDVFIGVHRLIHYSSYVHDYRCTSGYVPKLCVTFKAFLEGLFVWWLACTSDFNIA